MMKMGFSGKWRGWISECLRSISMSVLVNRSPTKELCVGRGLRQGDPLLPFLFLLAVEGLNLMLSKEVQMDLFEGYQFGIDGIRVSHLQYADETLLMGKKSWKNIWAIKSTLQLFELISRLKVNFHKSLLVGDNIHGSW